MLSNPVGNYKPYTCSKPTCAPECPPFIQEEKAVKNPSFDMEYMRKKADKFTKDPSIISYIFAILYTPQFQNNPQLYINDWKQKRAAGWKYEYQNKAFPFFQKYFCRPAKAA